MVLENSFIRKFNDPMSGLTHFIGALLAITGTVLLIVKACYPVKPIHIVTFSIFGAGSILLYTASTLYHWLPVSDKIRLIFRKIDHIMIFVMIAASYTPFCLIALKGGWGWSIFGCVWGITFLGIFVKMFWMGAPRWFSTSLYLIMGWIVLVAIWPLIQAMSAGGLFWLVLGGIFYTIGGVIYGLKRPNPFKAFGFHEIFHVLIILGTVAHFFSLYRHVVFIQ
ncbi:MAG: hemolysin III family protein [Desulfobacterales bacterium]|nr:hemolysin III family protein [Desulfobacterales bacterium]MCP4160298.1 hemolysin III family protein [Deltaproteobacteria bacterium]